MTYHSTTPFGQRPVSAGLLKTTEIAQAPAPIAKVDKWHLFRQLCVARLVFGVTDRDLTVLNALLTFLPASNLEDGEQTTVFPSNRALSERAHGMAESTLRRHIAALVKSGLLMRHDSPNGKRYARRDRDGGITQAFGFDLRPLLVRAREIALACQETEEAAAHYRELREQVILMKRDAIKLAEYAYGDGMEGNWDEIFDQLALMQRQSRRKLSLCDLKTLRGDVEKLLSKVQGMVLETNEMSANDADFARHYQNSNTDTFDSEPCLENGKTGEVIDPISAPTTEVSSETQKPEPTKMPLALVLKACPDILPYSQGPIQRWIDLFESAQLVHGMMGISRDAWDHAVRAMGPECAATVVAAILQKVGSINSPGGYLRSLTAKAELGKFSPGPMVMALLGSPARLAS